MELRIFLVFLLEVLNSPHFVRSVLYSNDFAVELTTDQHDAAQVAKAHGFHINSKLDHLNVYHFVHPDVPTKSSLPDVNYVNKLQADPRVKHVFQQEHLVRRKRNSRHVIHDKQQELPNLEVTDNSLYQRLVPRLQTKEVITNDEVPMKFDDPYFVDQWYLNNKGQTGGRAGLDLNVGPAWKKNFTGSGVVVCILDDGIDHTHPDLIDNYDPAASIDLNGDDEDHDPMPDTTDPNNGHGTHCAGAVVAKANNSVCGVGVAYEARIGGVRMLDGTITDILESKALFFKPNYINIYSASWGPIDDGQRMEAPKPFARSALQEGVKRGRNGLGVIYVWATGNGGLTFDDCNADGYVSSVETLAVGSVTNKGKIPYFMERCTSTMAVVPTGGLEDKPSANKQNRIIEVVTTGLHGQCIENFDGTSGAAPLAAGCISLVLQANPHLTWRDVQHLVIHSARIPSSEGGWLLNGAGLHVSHSYGFGLMDCARMVELAQHWQNVHPQRKCIYTSADMNKKVSFDEPIKIQIFCNGCSNMASSHLTHLEHVQVHINLKHSSRGDVQVFLISPAGTKSQLLSPRKFDQHKDIDFYFMTVHNWMENPYGNWKLEIHDKQNNQKDGILLKWSLILYGYKLNQPGKNLKSRKMTQREIGSIMEKEFSRKVNIKKYENPLLKEKLRISKKSNLSQKLEFIKNLSNKLSLTLTRRQLTQKPRSVAENLGASPLVLTRTEKFLNSQRKSKLSEEYQPTSKSIASRLLGEMIANNHPSNRKLDKSNIGHSLRENGNQISSKISDNQKESNEFQSEFLALKKLLDVADFTETKSLGEEHDGSNLSERNLDSLSESADQSLSSDFHLTKPNSSQKNSLGTKVSDFSHRVYAESMFIPSFDLINGNFTTEKSSEPVWKMRSEQPEELEDELESAKEKKELIDEFKMYPRSAKNPVT